MSEGATLYAMRDGVCFMKMTGDINYVTNGAFDAFIDSLFVGAGPKDMVIDLTEASSIDSTNLGLIAKAARLTMKSLGYKPTVISTGEDINLTLSSMGFDQVLTLVTDAAGGAEELESIPAVQPSERERLKTILEAHRTLVGLEGEGTAPFRRIVEALEKELGEGAR